jgi:uncharacterized membrane protein (DUF485 family)
MQDRVVERIQRNPKYQQLKSARAAATAGRWRS